MTRSLYKSTFISQDVLRKLKQKPDNSEPFVIKTRARNTVITDEMMGIKFNVHNGRYHKMVNITHPDMIGHKLGEFSFTKRMGSYLHKAGHAARMRKKKQKLLAKKKVSKTKTKKKSKKK